MASYTDKIPTFNPYVEQQPVDAMLKVGVYKQQKYEEGVKKIQTNIDNVAGLDVANDVDKQYLQSKYYIYSEMNPTNNTGETHLITADINIDNTQNSNWNISIYDAYIYYCKYRQTNYPLNQTVSKSFFEKYIFENFNEYIVESKFISVNWIYY